MVVGWEYFCALKSESRQLLPGQEARRSVAYLHWATMAITVSIQANESPPSCSPIQALPAALNGPLLGKSKTIPYSAHRVGGTVPVAGPMNCFLTWTISSLPRRWRISLISLAFEFSFLRKLIGCLSLVLIITQSRDIHSLHILQIRRSWL